MAYTIKDVFYLSTSATIASGTANSGSAQLDLSAYIDPIARGRTKGTGLAVYKCYYSMGQATPGSPSITWKFSILYPVPPVLVCNSIVS